jgi:hypothetical protein
MASRANRPANSLANVLHPQYFDVFGHFASNSLSGGSLLRLSKCGQHMGLRQNHLASELKLLNSEIVGEALKFLGKQELKYDVLLNYLAAMPYCETLNHSLLSRHIMWMLKYGLIEVVE